MNRRKEIKKNLELKKIIKRKGYKLYVKWKCYDNSFNSWIDKKDIVQRSEFFLESKSSNWRVKVKLDWSDYATKTYLKNATGVDTSSFAEKADLTG